MLSELLGFFSGIILGLLAGITPGIHSNLITGIIQQQFSFLSPSILIPLIISLAVAQSFADIIPAVFLNAPDEDTALAVMPGHQLLHAGRSIDAVSYSLAGSSLGIISASFLAYPTIVYFPIIVSLIKPFLGYLLLFICLYGLLRESNPLASLTIFLLAGFLGLVTFASPVRQPLLPLLTGLFGASGIIFSLKEKTTIPKQSEKIIEPPLSIIKENKLLLIISAILASFGSILPAISSGQIIALIGEIKKTSKESFLLLTGFMSSFLILMSFFNLFSLNTAHTGAAAALKSSIGTYSIQYIILVAVVSSIISFFISKSITKHAVKLIKQVNYTLLSYLVLAIIILIILIFTNFAGYLVFCAATSLGLWAMHKPSKKINLMGSLLVPTILFYLLH